MLIDFHTHAFPDRIAQRAVSGLSQGCGGMVPQTDGTLNSLKEQMDKDGVDISVVLSIATNPKQQTNVNNFAMEINQDDRIIAFGSIHPDAPVIICLIQYFIRVSFITDSVSVRSTSSSSSRTVYGNDSLSAFQPSCTCASGSFVFS